ncbi:MAG: hypothetical protein EBS30_15280, partial [Planctomycetes bacterium]|nr:hypothetical protein [Planctomycetota bacterium]
GALAAGGMLGALAAAIRAILHRCLADQGDDLTVVAVLVTSFGSAGCSAKPWAMSSKLAISTTSLVVSTFTLAYMVGRGVPDAAGRLSLYVLYRLLHHTNV